MRWEGDLDIVCPLVVREDGVGDGGVVVVRRGAEPLLVASFKGARNSRPAHWRWRSTLGFR